MSCKITVIIRMTSGLTSLYQAKLNHIFQKEKHLEPLPPGWFYNGSQYVDMSGERLDRHPDFDKFLQQYVDKENQGIYEYNNKIDQLEYKDLFE